MSLHLHASLSPSAESADVLRARFRAGVRERAVLFVSNYAAALERRKEFARAADSLRFGVEVTTLDAWLSDRWELFGDGRALVSSVERKLAMSEVVRRLSSRMEIGLACLPGTVDLLAEKASVALGLEGVVSVFDDAGSNLADATETERDVLRVVSEYKDYLSERALCEPAEALRLLANGDDAVFENMVVEEDDAPSLVWAVFFEAAARRKDVVFVVAQDDAEGLDVAGPFVSLFDSLGATVACSWKEAAGEFRCGNLCSEELPRLRSALFHPATQSRVAPTGAVRVLVPEGRYAQDALLVDDLSVVAGTGSVVVACKDAKGFLDRLAPSLLRRGVASRGLYSVRFVDTDFGRAFFNMKALLDSEGRDFDASQAVDFALSFFEGITLERAGYFDEVWRNDRLVERDDVVNGLADYSADGAAPFIGLLESGRLSEALDAAYGRYLRLAADDAPASYVQSMRAIEVARNLVATAEAMGCSAESALEQLWSASVQLVVSSDPDGNLPVVEFVSYKDASRLLPGSIDTVYICGMNADDQSLRIARNVVDDLFEKCGYRFEADMLTPMRTRFASIVRSARKTVVFERALNSEQADPLYPSVLFEDAMACYADEGTGRIGKTGIPEPLDPYVRRCGEDGLSSVFRSPFCKGEARQLGVKALDEISDSLKSLVTLPVSTSAGICQDVCLSPSALEAYVDCPRKWFSQRRLGLSGIGAEFGSAEKGSFAHDVLKAFHERLLVEPFGPRVTEDNIEESKNLLDEVFLATEKQQWDAPYRGNRLVALTEEERRCMDELHRMLRDYVVREAAFLPGFVPYRFEWPFGYDEPVEYAGVGVRGRIDRIDRDENGNAVVIDYKSSVSDDYRLASEKGGGYELPRKIQTLVYAQVVRRVLGLNVVGALYVRVLGSKSQPLINGAYDNRVFGKEDLLGIKADYNALSALSFDSFDDLLDRVEQDTAEQVECLLGGNIPVRPRRDSVCNHCPVRECEGRS